jgi:hypothetical protein
MFLRNHGLVVAGRTVEEAFTRAYHTVLACEAQITMMSAGLENLIIVSEEAKQRSMVSLCLLKLYLLVFLFFYDFFLPLFEFIIQHTFRCVLWLLCPITGSSSSRSRNDRRWCPQRKSRTERR